MYYARLLLKTGEVLEILHEMLDITDGFVYLLINSNKGSIERKIVSSDLIASIHQKEVTNIE